MSTSSEATIAGDLVRIHLVLTRALDVAVKYSQSFAQKGYPDQATRTGFISYLETFISLLDIHHHVEDDRIFPYLREKLTTAPFDLMEKQHQEMLPVLDQVSKSLEGVKANPEAGGELNDLHSKLIQLREFWHFHYQTEEKYITEEIVGSLVNLDEQVQQSHGFAAYSGQLAKQPFLLVPFILYNLSVEDRAVMSQVFPPKVTQDLIPGEWREKWAVMSPFLLV